MPPLTYRMPLIELTFMFSSALGMGARSIQLAARIGNASTSVAIVAMNHRLLGSKPIRLNMGPFLLEVRISAWIVIPGCLKAGRTQSAETPEMSARHFKGYTRTESYYQGVTASIC